MSRTRKCPQQFKSMWELVTELEKVGHSQERLWFSGKMVNGKQCCLKPVQFISADCRMIAQKHSDGTWWTLYGYDDAVNPNTPDPTNDFRFEEYSFQLSMIIP